MTLGQELASLKLSPRLPGCLYRVETAIYACPSWMRTVFHKGMECATHAEILKRGTFQYD